jgi:hypothetical protein
MKHFTIEELTRSATARRKGIPNLPNGEEKENLTALVDNVLDPLRELWGAPIIVTSGYRCARLNRLVGGAAGSQHMKGQAADIDIQGDMEFGRKIFDYIKNHLPFDQLIWEHTASGTYWVHVSFVFPDFGKNRKNVINNLQKK